MAHHTPAGDSEGNDNPEQPQAPNTPGDEPACGVTTGLEYIPPPPQTHPRAYRFRETIDNPHQHIPTPTVQTENKPIEELVRLNTAEDQTRITEMEQQTIQTATIREAQTRFSAYLAKHQNRLVTTEHIRRQTPDSTWYNRATYQLPTHAQNEPRKLMTVQHEADSDGLHTAEDMADAAHYTVHTEVDHQGTPDTRNRSYLLLPQSTGTQRNHE